MYIPKEARPVNELPTLPRRLGIQGLAGTGKTWAALTFPNPLVLDIDNKLGGYRNSRPEATFPVIPFWNADFVNDTLKTINDTYNKRIDKSIPHNIRDAVKRWLEVEGSKLQPGQTLILDSISSLNDGFDTQTQLPFEVARGRNGEEDGFAFWKRKLAYNCQIASLLKGLPCNVVAIFHEQFDRDEDGRIIGIKPLIQGQSADKMPGYFTDFYRQRVITQDHKDIWPTLSPRLGETEIYVWQTCKDKLFQIACKSQPNIKPYVRASYQEAFGVERE